MPDPIRPVESRITRRCDTCGLIDDHPRHDTTDHEGVTLSRHMDCCGCELCAATLGVADGAHGLDLAEFIVEGGAAEAVAPLLESEG